MLVRNYNNNVVVINYFYVSEDIPAMGGQVPYQYCSWNSLQRVQEYQFWD
jgi:hypothetical protein